MEDINKKRLILAFVVLAIIIVAGIILGLKLSQDKEPGTNTGKPINPLENPARQTPLDATLGYGCGGPGSFNPEKIEEEDKVWSIKKNGSEKIVSLGKYRIDLPERTATDADKLWFYFMSNALSEREDKWYGLESSYVSGMVLSVNGYKKEINLGGDEYMFIELTDYPFGDWYPYLKDQYLEFEILVKLKCRNIKNGACLGNNNELLERISNADIRSQIRIFVLGCDPFTIDLSSEAVIKYE